jgi:hypothetical protein
MVVLGFCCACASTDPVVASDGAGTQHHLQKVRSDHQELLARLAKAPADDVASCKLNAGDCLLQVSESRAQMVRTYRLDPCEQQPDPESKAACVTKQLEDGRHTGPLASYYALENWCLGKLTACTVVRAEEARLAVLDQRFELRKQTLEAEPAATTARSLVQLTRAKISYLRTSLPPNGSEQCQAAKDVDACQARVAAGQQALDEQLRLDEYAASAGLQQYEALKQLEASCDAPELACLSSALANYGVLPEARKLVDRNLALLAQRQELASRLREPESSECVTGPQLAHQSEIVAAYVPYVREPVLYFRMQLDKAFLSLHQAQITCLSSRRKASL